MLTATSKHAATILDTDSAGKTLREAVAQALATPGGPASIEWPIDLQYAEHDIDVVEQVSESARTPDADELAAALSLLAAAERPVIWAGGGVARAGAELTELVERWGVPLLTSNSGRGAVPEDHPLCIGNYGNTPVGRELLQDADLLLSLGTHFRSNETGDYSMPVPAVHVQVDVDAAALGRVYPAQAGVTAEIGTFLRALTDLAPADAAWTERARTTRELVRSKQRAGLGDHAVLCDAVRAAFPQDSVIARDVTIASSSWGNRLLPMFDPKSNVFPAAVASGRVWAWPSVPHWPTKPGPPWRSSATAAWPSTSARSSPWRRRSRGWCCSCSTTAATAYSATCRRAGVTTPTRSTSSRPTSRCSPSRSGCRTCGSAVPKRPMPCSRTRSRGRRR